MKNKIIYPFLLLVLSFYTGCEEMPTEGGLRYPPDNYNKVTITQGVWGNVWFWEGDFMPVYNSSSGGKITAVVREIYIYKATTDSMAEPANYGPWFRKINSEFVIKIKSDKSGFFQTNLPPGVYSFFIKEDSLFYANGLDNNGHILSAKVARDSVTKRQIDINYKAYY